MIRVTLFSEHNGVQFFGEDLLDAFRRVKGVRFSDSWDPGIQRPIRGREFEIAAVLDEVDVTNSRRGDTQYRSVLVELADHQLMQIDCVVSPVGVVRAPADEHDA